MYGLNYYTFKRGDISRIAPSFSSSIVDNFLNRCVQIKVKEGYIIEGVLLHVDYSQKHNGIGNLVLADRTIIRGSHVQHIATKKGRQQT